MSSFNSSRARITSVASFSGGSSDRAVRPNDQITLVVNISVDQSLVDAGLLYKLNYHIIDPFRDDQHLRNWLWADNHAFNWGRNFWTSFSWNRVSDMGVGRGVRIFKAEFVVKGSEEFAVSDDHYFLVRFD